MNHYVKVPDYLDDRRRKKSLSTAVGTAADRLRGKDNLRTAGFVVPRNISSIGVLHLLLHLSNRTMPDGNAF